MTRQERREREEQILREEILAIAERIFSSNGYHQTKVSAIARQAEIGVGTIYKLFGNKEDLYFALIDQQVERMHRSVREVSSQYEDPLDQLRALMQASFEQFAANRQFITIYFNELGGTSWNLRHTAKGKVHEKLEAHIEFFMQIFQRGIEQGAFRDIDARRCTLVLGGIFKELLADKIATGEAIDPIKDVEFALDIYLKGIGTERVSKRHKDNAEGDL